MDDIKKVAWNSSQGLIMEISNRRSYANTLFINGNIKKAFNTLIAVKQSVIQSFGQEERMILKTIEDEFKKISNCISSSYLNSFNKQTRSAYFSAMTIAEDIYARYNEQLQDLLEKYGYLIGEQTDASKMRF